MPKSPEEVIQDLKADITVLKVICALELAAIVGLIALLLK